MRSITSRTSGTWLPDRIDRPTTCTLSSTRGAHDLRRRQADAFVDDLHAAVAGAHGDLLGAVGVAVEARLADQELDAAAELGRDALRPRRAPRRAPRRRAPTATAPTPVGARYSPKTSRSARPIRRW